MTEKRLYLYPLRSAQREAPKRRRLKPVVRAKPGVHLVRGMDAWYRDEKKAYL